MEKYELSYREYNGYNPIKADTEVFDNFEDAQKAFDRYLDEFAETYYPFNIVEDNKNAERIRLYKGDDIFSWEDTDGDIYLNIAINTIDDEDIVNETAKNVSKPNVESASELYNRLYQIDADAKLAIVELIKANNLDCIDFFADKEGRTAEDDGYDEEFVFDYAINVECETRYDEGFFRLAKVEINPNSMNNNNVLLLTAQGNYDEIPNSCVYPTTATFIDILARLETMIEK